MNQFWAHKDEWYPTWNYPQTHDSALKVDSIKVWQYPEEDAESTYSLSSNLNDYKSSDKTAPTYIDKPEAAPKKEDKELNKKSNNQTKTDSANATALATEIASK